jgi:hypothetical protein
MAQQQGQATRLAAIASYHPDPRAKQLARYQTNNPLNLAGLEPQVRSYGIPYGDGRVSRPDAGVTLTPNPQQQVITRPSKAGAMPGHPAFMLDQEMAFGTQGRNGTARPLLMSTSEARPQGNPRAAMDRGISGSGAGGMNTSLSARSAAAGRGPARPVSRPS